MKLYCIAFVLLLAAAVCVDRLVETTAGVILIFVVIGVAQVLVGLANREPEKNERKENKP